MANPGESFRINGMRGSRDRNNVVQLTIPYFAATFPDIFKVGADSVARSLGLVEMTRSFSDAEEGSRGYLVDVSYAGLTDDDEGEETMDFSASFSEEPINSHPNWKRIKAFYGGSVDEASGKVTFPEDLPGRTIQINAQVPLSGANGGSDFRDYHALKKVTPDRPNPMHGQETHLDLKTVFRHTYVVRKLPKNIFDKIGTIVEKLPEGFPTPKDRNWLVMPPTVSLFGNAYKISDELLLSKLGGWPREVYGLITK